jgi:hypothetical protein
MKSEDRMSCKQLNNKMRFALSYVGALAVALTQSLGGTILTGDPEILKLDSSLRIERLERH